MVHSKNNDPNLVVYTSTFLFLFNDVLTGLPSVVIGIVGYITIVLTIGSFSVLAGAFSIDNHDTHCRENY
jgi:ABC-type phosphate transport system permease subunit